MTDIARKHEARRPSDTERLHHILDAVAAIRRYRDDDTLPPRVRTVWLLWHTMLIGEASNALPDDVLQAMPKTPWRKVIDMRHFLVHEYFTEQEAYVEDVAANHIDPLATEIEQYLADAGDDPQGPDT